MLQNSIIEMKLFKQELHIKEQLLQNKLRNALLKDLLVAALDHFNKRIDASIDAIRDRWMQPEASDGALNPPPLSSDECARSEEVCRPAILSTHSFINTTIRTRTLWLAHSSSPWNLHPAKCSCISILAHCRPIVLFLTFLLHCSLRIAI